MTALRRARVQFAKRRRARDGVPLDAWGRVEDDQAAVVIATWSSAPATRPKARSGWRWRPPPAPANDAASLGRN